MNSFTDNHRYLVQYMLKNGAVTQERALEYIKVVSKGDISNILELQTLVIQINLEISKQSFRIIFHTCEITNKILLVWIDTKITEMSKNQTKFSATELEYFHKVLLEIFQREDRRITSLDFVNVAATSSLNMKKKEKLLETLLKLGYFIIKEPYIYLGAKLVLEYASYLKEKFPDSICDLCSEFSVLGEKCVSCQKIFHSNCLDKYFKVQKNCPHCKKTWNRNERSQVEEDNSMEYDSD